MFKQILVPVDGSPASNRALQAALALAREQNATLNVLHVVSLTAVTPVMDGGMYVPQYLDAMMEALREGGQDLLAKARAAATKDGVTTQTKLIESGIGDVAQAILAHAKKLRADLIVMGTHGRRGLSRILMGSDAESVLREAAVPVLLVRAPAARRARASGTKTATGKRQPAPAKSRR